MCKPLGLVAAIVEPVIGWVFGLRRSEAMPPSVADAILQLVRGAHGVLAVVISDRDGVELHRIVRDDRVDLQLSPSALATFAMTAEQVGKLRLGGEGVVTSAYEHLVIVHGLCGTLNLCIVAEGDANVGMTTAMMPELKRLLTDVRLTS